MRSAPLSPFLLPLPESVVVQPPADKPPSPPSAPPRPVPAEPANQN